MKRTPLILSFAILASLLSLEVAVAQENRPLGPAPLVHEDGSPSAPADRGVLGGMILPLAGVLAMIAACGYAFRVASAKSGGLMGAIGAGGRAPSGVLSVLGRYPVSRGSTLVLLKVDRRVLLISQSSSRTGGVGMQTLCEITDPEEVASILIKTRDEEEAARLYQKACDGGSSYGCSNLGFMYEHGKGGLAVDEVKAVGLYRPACDAGVGRARRAAHDAG